jgi:hypothetical protein
VRTAAACLRAGKRQHKHSSIAEGRCARTPAIVESLVFGVVICDFGDKVFDALARDPASIQSCAALILEAVGVKREQRVLGTCGAQRVFEGEEAAQIFCVCEERRPYCGSKIGRSATWIRKRKAFKPFGDSTARALLDILGER